MKLCIFFSNDNVVNILLQTLFVQIKAGLDRINGRASGQRSYDITVVQSKLCRRSVFVSINGNQFPIIISDPVMLLQGFLDGEDFNPLLLDMTMDHRCVFQEIGAASFLFGDIQSCHNEPLLICLW